MKKSVMETAYKYYYKWRRLEAHKKMKGDKQGASFLKGECIARAIDRLHKQAYKNVGRLQCEGYVTAEPVPFERRTEGKKVVIKQGTVWAEKVFDCAWFHVTGDLPKTDNVVMLIDCGGEGLVFNKDGKAIQGITSRYSQFSPDLGLAKKIVVDVEPFVEDDMVDFWIDCGANDLFGNRKNDSRVSELCFAEYYKEVDALAYDMEVLFDVYAYNYNEDFEKRIIKTLLSVLPKTRVISNEKAILLRKELAPLLAEKNDKYAFTFHSIGHAHLDLAWLWPLRESHRKGGRTFANQLRNIKNYPGYIFGASQAQLYDWVKKDYPELYGEVKKAVKEKRWDVQGATWVEPDSFCISGESLIRQFYYGKKFFRKEFGQDMKIFWVPDSFGYSGCLPTVMNLAGVPYFLTQKMSWNKYNKFPYHTFRWEGLDGSTVLAHMLPECTYNGAMNTYSFKKAEKYYYERKYNNEAMALFGIGDGGAGPGVEHIERAVRMADLKDTPKVDFKLSADFFKDIDDPEKEYPVFKGELYLEKHQGTQTSHGKNKFYNRKCEFALKNYDLLVVAAKEKGIVPPLGQERIDEIWKEILLYQFHDILPGSSIDRVYTESEERYEIIYKELTSAIATLASALADGASVFNPNPYSYRLPVKIDDNWYDVNAKGLSAVSVAGLDDAVSSVKASENTLENEYLKVVFKDGVIVSLYDKKMEKEFVPHGGKTAVISKYVDNGDAWDFPKDYREKKKDAVCTGFATYVDGPEAYAEATYTVDDNKIAQRFSLLSGSRQVTVKMKVDCHQEASMLRIAFPVDIYTSECAFNVQYGHLTRRTTEENSIEKAQFEVNGQKFVDMSEINYGVSVLNDCKYGFRCKGNVMDMNLIRTPKKGPSHQPEQGEHEINYAILVHEGPMGEETYKAAYLLNNPLVPVLGSGSGLDLGFTCDNDNVVVEAIKPSDDGKGFVARVYNSSSKSQTANLTFAGKTAVCRTDIFENKIADAETPLTLRKFELVILKFE
ncbi:MAG: alpha-mannosidase [Clostridia bacterium]|nr:alpha-mannosidase [Clostridia bacterium]